MVNYAGLDSNMKEELEMFTAAAGQKVGKVHKKGQWPLEQNTHRDHHRCKYHAKERHKLGTRSWHANRQPKKGIDEEQPWLHQESTSSWDRIGSFIAEICFKSFCEKFILEVWPHCVSSSMHATI